MTTRVGGRVSFFLGASRRELGKGPRLDDGGAGGSHSSTDVEDDYPDVYAQVDPDDYFAPCLGRMLGKTTRAPRKDTASRGPECRSQESSVSTLVGDGHGTVPVVVIRGTDVVSSPPDGDLKHFADRVQLALNVSRCSSGTNLGDVEDNCLGQPPILGAKSAPGSGTHSAAASTAGMRSLPPSPPASPPVSPGSSFTPLLRNERIEPRAPRDHGLIPINLEPVSPMTLAAAVSTDGYEFDDDYDDDEDDRLDDDRLDHHLNGPPYTTTASTTHGQEPDFDVPAYALDDGNLALEEHPYVVDRFYDRPLLHDPEVPFVKASPVFDSVDDLFAAHYPELRPGSVEYAYHKGRLLRNRAKLRRLAEKLRREHSARRSRISLARLHRKNSHDRPRVCPDIYY